MIANAQLMPAISNCRVDNTSCFPTHRPLGIEICTGKLEVVVNQLQKPTNFAELFEAKVQEAFEQQEDMQQEDSTSVGSNNKKKKKKKKKVRKEE